jgi:hypothetical protein
MFMLVPFPFVGFMLPFAEAYPVSGGRDQTIPGAIGTATVLQAAAGD